MRKILFLLFVVVLLAPSMTRLGAADSDVSKQTSEFKVWQPQILGLPSFDIRQELAGFRQASGSKASAQTAAAKARLNAAESFRLSLSPDIQADLRYEINEAGVPKTFFNLRGSLSGPASGSADEIARGFLKKHKKIFGLASSDDRVLKLETEDNDDGTTFLVYNQTIDGINVFQGQVQIAVDADGEVLSIMEGMVISESDVDTFAGLPEEKALAVAFKYAGREAAEQFVLLEARSEPGGQARYQNPLGEGYEDVISDLRIMNIEDKGVLAWHFYLEAGSSEWYEICLDADTGALLFRCNLYADVAQGTVFKRDPIASPRTLESFVGDTAINTAAGWMGTSTKTTGNNVDAYLDTIADNLPDATTETGLMDGRAFAQNQNFTFPFALGVDPRTQRPAVVTNLFYFVNIAHDFHYRLGFTESAGNFQTNNFGRGGVGNDPVNAEAQDGSGTNNANFATPADGSRPRMQQFLFTQGTSSLADDRDSSQDGDVVLHEYGHGVSNRLVGGPSNVNCLNTLPQPNALGEGWSDYWAITFYNDGRVGEYVTNNAINGIRRAAYTIPANPVHDSYADLITNVLLPHPDGEVWAATLWDLRNELGAAITDRMVMQGMKFTPCNPSFLQARDAILQADQSLNGGVNRCRIWAVFARHGMGVSATGNSSTMHNAATDVPADCPSGSGPFIFFDNFETNQSWVINANGTDTATKGQWQRGDPQDTNSGGPKQLGTTVSGLNDLVTGRAAGASATSHDIDGGVTSIRSPSITLPSTGTLTMTFSYYLAHGNDSSNADFLRISIKRGATLTKVFERLGAATNRNAVWASASVNLAAFAGRKITILIEAADGAGESLVEAAIDDLKIVQQ